MIFRRIIELIPVARRKQGAKVIFSTLFQALLNMAGLTVLIPLIILIFDPGKLIAYPWFASHRNLVIVLVVLFVIIKNLLSISINNSRIRYINKLYAYYAGRLYDAYYRQGLLFIKEKHSDELTYNTNAISYLFSHGVLALTFSMISEALLLLFIWCAIAWFSPLAALGIAVSLIPFVAVYYYWFRKRLSAYGKEENEAKRRSMTYVGDTFRAYPDVKLNDAYPWFKERFDKNIEVIARCRQKIGNILHVPSGMIECYIVIGMILFVIIGGNDAGSRVFMGVLAVAVLRMLPSIRSLITMAIQWKNSIFTVDILNDIPEVKDIKKREEQSVSFKRQLKIENLGYRYPGKELFVLKGISLQVNKGECVGIKGMSGIGKTTLFNLLLGFYTPQEGRIYIDDMVLDEQTCPAWQRLIAYVPQDIFIMDGTLAENIAFGAADIDTEQMELAIERSGLGEYISSLPGGVATRVGQNGSFLSGGERQRLGIARALYKKAEVLFFDEATSSLDLKTEEGIMDTIRNLSKGANNLTILIISHKPSALSYCDRVVEMG